MELKWKLGIKQQAYQIGGNQNRILWFLPCKINIGEIKIGDETNLKNWGKNQYCLQPFDNNKHENWRRKENQMAYLRQQRVYRVLREVKDERQRRNEAWEERRRRGWKMGGEKELRRWREYESYWEKSEGVICLCVKKKDKPYVTGGFCNL